MLSVYSSADPNSELSSDSSYQNPLAFSVDGQTGAIISKKLFLRNDNSNFYYTDIELTPVTQMGLDLVSGATNGFTWKLVLGDTEPTEIQWASVSPANTIVFSDIGSLGNGDIVTYLPFWLRIEVPRNIDVQVFQGSTLQISGTENAV